MDATDKDLQELLDAEWFASASSVVTKSGREVCDLFGVIGYFSAELVVAQHIADDHNQVEALKAENAGLLAVVEAAMVFMDTCVWQKHPVTGDNEQSWGTLEKLRLLEATDRAQETTTPAAGQEGDVTSGMD